jgi:hypothetical protein
MARPPVKPIVSQLPHQEELFWADNIRRAGAIWRRRGRKSTTLANIALRRMLQRRGHTCIFASATVDMAKEFLLKEIATWQLVIEIMKTGADRTGKLFEWSGEGVDADGLVDLFEHSKLHTKIWHDQTSYSRTLIVPATPRTVGYGGDVFFDEIARAPELQGCIEAVLPFMDENPELIFRLATTPPPDDTHYSFEYLMPEQESFEVNARGNWYRAASGIMVHRADVWDCQAAGLKLYHPDTGAVVAPEEHRALAFDKTAWDRNYACSFVRGGTAAVGIAALQNAMALGRGQCLARNITEEIALV